MTYVMRKEEMGSSGGGSITLPFGVMAPLDVELNEWRK